MMVIGQTPGWTAMVSVTDLPKSGVLLIGPSDNQYSAFFNKLGFSTAPVLDGFKPYSVLIRNAGESGVVGYAIRWTVTSPSGKSKSTTFFSSVPASLKLPRRNPNDGVSKASPAPNEVQLVAPAFRVQAGGKLPPNALLQAWLPELQRYAAATAINVALDSVIFEDGTWVGENKSHFVDVFQAQISAEHDVKLAVHRARARRASVEEVFGTVKEMAGSDQLQPPGMDSPPSEWYRYYCQLTAREILSVRDTSGDEAALSVVYTHFYSVRPLLAKGAQ
ncbi:MAG TPA: hypothetical protein VN736_09895 [Candidatus Limnocylindrales bacterium]|nr:hypothetical protein [Candidatus Limnocylindrales bacterium]